MLSRGYIEEVCYTKPSARANEYPHQFAFLKDLKALPLDSRVTFFIGENGTGKSTLLEAIAIAYGFNAEGGSLNFNFATKDSSSSLHESLLLKKSWQRAKDGFFLRAESFYNVATEVERLNDISPFSPETYGGKSLHEQSHGESFLALMNHRFGGNGLYVLDEPEAALSAQRQLSLLSRMHELVKQDSQFLIATHSPILLSYPNATIYSMDENGIHQQTYTECEPYRFIKMFSEQYEQVLHYLLT